LGAFGGFGGLGQRPVHIQVLVATALCLWLASVFVYIGAIAWSPGSSASPKIHEMLNSFSGYAKKLRARVRLGSYVALFAVAFTLLSVVALAIESIRDYYGEQDVVVSLAAATAAAISTSCGWKADSDQLRAKVRVRDLSKTVVPLRLGDNRQNVALDSEGKSEDICKGRQFRVPTRSVLATHSAGQVKPASP
jgi:hypothetical protein